CCYFLFSVFFFFQAEDGIRDDLVTGVQTCALPISILRTPLIARLLPTLLGAIFGRDRGGSLATAGRRGCLACRGRWFPEFSQRRSEERRVGKGSGSRGSAAC